MLKLREHISNLRNDKNTSSNDCQSFVTLNEIPTWKEQTEVFVKNEQLNNKVSIFVGDITTLVVDAIVNATDNVMSGSGGVDLAIRRAAGQLLTYQCKTAGLLETGEAKITFGAKLPAKYVIHTSGPNGIGQNNCPMDRNLLENCYWNSLTLAMERGLRSIAFPCIATGTFGYPHKDAAQSALRTVRRFMEINDSQFDRVIFCLFLPVDVEIYKSLMKTYFPV